MTAVHPAAFVKHLSENGFARKEIREDGTFLVHLLSFASVKLRVGHMVTVLTPHQKSSDGPTTRDGFEQLLAAAVPIARNAPENFVVLVSGGKLPDDCDDLRQRAADTKIAFFQQSDIALVMAADSPVAKETALANALVRSLGRTTLSPYMAGLPAYGGRFFGRSAMIRKMQYTGRTGPSYAIVGNRRIGKTSLLRELRHRLELQDDSAKCVDLYATNCHSTYEVLHSLLMVLDPRQANKFDKNRAFHEFPETMRSIAAQGNVYLFIDEADDLLTFDSQQEYQCLHLLRAAWQQGACRIFFAGFRQLMDAKNRFDTPLHNFVRYQTLDGLTLNETDFMVSRPFELLDINIAPRDLTAMIYRETCGYPELIQMFCSEILALNEQDDAVPDANQLADYVFGSEAFRTAVFGTFLGSTNALEQLLVYSLVSDCSGRNLETYEFELRDIERVLRRTRLDLGFPEAYKLMDHLRLGGVIAQVGGTNRYHFSVPQLARYCMQIDLNGSIEDALKRARERDLVASLMAEPDPKRESRPTAR